MEHFNYSGIYKITNLINNKFYIGSAVNIKKRWKYHRRDFRRGKHHSTHFQRAWNKYGAENFKYEVLIRCPKEYLLKLEQWFLDTYTPWKNKIGYNVSKIAGSCLGTKRTKEQREKMSFIQKNRTWKPLLSKEGIEAISLVNSHPRKPGVKEKIRETRGMLVKEKLIRVDLLKGLTGKEIVRLRKVNYRLIKTLKKELKLIGKFTIERDDGVRFRTEWGACQTIGVSKGCITKCIKSNWQAGGFYWKKINVLEYES